MTCANPACNAPLPPGAAHCPSCGTAARGGMDTDDGRDTNILFRLHEGAMLGNFRLERFLGRGGMGDVWLARDTHLKDEPVALKILKESAVTDERAIDALRDEVILTRKLTHPNVVRVHAFHAEQGIHFISMEFVEGVSLEKALYQHKGPFPLERVLGWARDLAAAIDYAHGQGVLHRDIKPGNMLLADDGTVKLADFGIARVAKDSTTRATGHITSGTLLYMSPQQLMGEKPDKASDIYSLAASLYELLSGNPPFHQGSIETQILHKEPSPIEGLPEAANAALLAGLEKKPGARPAPAKALSDALGGKKAGAERPRKSAGGRRRALATLCVVGVIAAVAATGWVAWQEFGGVSPPAGQSAGTQPEATEPRASTPTQQRAAALTETPRPDSWDADSEAESTETPAAADTAAPPPEPTVPTATEASAARIAALKAQSRAEGASAEAYAADTLAAATRAFEEGEGRDDKREYAAAITAYENAEQQYAVAEKDATRVAGEVRAVESAREAANTAKAEADRLDAATWATARYEQAQSARRLAAAQENENRPASAKKYDEAAEFYTIAANEAKNRPPQPGEEREFAGMAFVWIPPGSFTMSSPTSEKGRDDDEAQHRVTLTQGFWMGKYEVTQSQWESVMGNNPSNFKGSDRPVETISWEDCQEFLRKLNRRDEGDFRLPTEAEWEYACRAGTSTAYGFGNDPNELGTYAWYSDNSGRETHPVGRRRPNNWGLHDMHGNVWEWCADWYGDYPNGSVTDPKGPATGQGRVLRGGSWNNNAGLCRAANRDNSTPDGRNLNHGFRVVRTD